MTSLPIATPSPRPRVDGRLDEAFQRARLKVVPRRRVRAARMPFVTLVSLVLLGGVVGLLCFNTQMQQASFAQNALQTENSTLSAREQTLHDQVQSLRDPQHLAAAAQHSGMVIPATSCTLTIGTGVTQRACTPANADNTPPLVGQLPAKPVALDPKPIVTLVQAAPVVTAPTGTTATTATTGNTGTGHHHRHHRRARRHAND